jgi:hypothetical protein
MRLDKSPHLVPALGLFAHLGGLTPAFSLHNFVISCESVSSQIPLKIFVSQRLDPCPGPLETSPSCGTC